MTTIPDTFVYDGFTFNLLKRHIDICLFEKSKTTPYGHYKGYEVVKLVVYEPHTFPSGKTYDFRERMPNSELWGTYGWSYMSISEAYAKFESLV